MISPVPVELQAEVLLMLPGPWALQLMDLQSQAIKELLALSGSLTADSDLGSFRPLVIEAFPVPDRSSSLSHFPPELRGAARKGDIIVRFATGIETQLPDPEPPSPPFPVEQIPRLSEGIAAEELANYVSGILLGAALAKPGVIVSAPATVIANGTSQTRVPPIGGDLMLARRKAENLGWPPIRDLPIAAVLPWLQQVPSFADGIPTGPVGRAVAAFSHLVGEESTARVVWALVGLEALYCTGIADLKTQLMEKSEVLLGPRDQFKRRFGQMYDFRSRFVHGDVDLPLQYSTYLTAQHDRFNRDYDESEMIATAMLVATLQELVARGWHSLSYRYQVVPPLSTANMVEGEA